MDKIVRLNKRHIEQLVQVDYESEHQGDREQGISKPYMKMGIVDRFKKKQEIFFGYKRDNILVGYATLKPFFPGHNHCEVYWLAVRKDYQGQGIGQRLIEFVEQYARSRGFRRVCLYTGKEMIKSRGFYEKLGYIFVNEFPGFYGYKKGNKTAVLYAKSLK